MVSRHCRRIQQSVPFRTLRLPRDFAFGSVATSIGARAYRRVPALVGTAVRRIPLPQTADVDPEEVAKLRNAAVQALRPVVPADQLTEAWPAPSRMAPVFSALTHRWSYLHRSAVRYGDSPEQLLDVWRHRDLPRKPAPVLIFVPGGAWVYGNRRFQGYALMAHLAQQGWLCLAIDHRAGRGHQWPRQVLDVKEAVGWARTHADDFGGDPGFVAIAGASSGAHLAALTALTHDDDDYGLELPTNADTSVDAAVALYGCYDWECRATRRDKGFVKFLERGVVGKRISDYPQIFRNASPIARVREDAPPFFVVHGAEDKWVPVSNARAFVDKLCSTSQSPVGYLEVPGARHVFDMTDRVRTGTAITAIRIFLDEVHRNHLSGRARKVV